MTHNNEGVAALMTLGVGLVAAECTIVLGFGCTGNSARSPVAPLQAIAVESPTVPLVEIS